MGIAKLKIPAAVIVVCVAFFVTFMQVKANEETDDPISESAVWSPDAGDLDNIAQTCRTDTAGSASKCFVDQMGSYASSEAVAFSQSLFDQTPSHVVGYLKALREAGPVDLGYVAYPDAEGSRLGWVLINGNPAIVDVDNLSLLPRAALEGDQRFKVLQTQYPHITLSVENDDRKAESMPEMQALGDGSQRFLIGYSFKEPCGTCQAVAHAAFGFDFDPTGKFLGVRFLRIVPVNQ